MKKITLHCVKMQLKITNNENLHKKKVKQNHNKRTLAHMKQ